MRARGDEPLHESISESVIHCLHLLADSNNTKNSLSPLCHGQLRGKATESKTHSQKKAERRAWSLLEDTCFSRSEQVRAGRKEVSSTPQRSIQIDGDWTSPFASSQPISFSTESGGQVDKSAISSWSYFGFAQVDSMDLIEIRYRDHATTLRIIADRHGLDPRKQVCPRLCGEWHEWFYSTLPLCYVALTLPVFDVDDLVVVRDGSGADEKPICYQVAMGLFALGSVDRKASETVMIGSAHPPELECVIDQPFFWAVIDHETGNIPAMGLTLEPLVSNSSST